MQKLGMKEGFDIGLEMSGNPKAFTTCLPSMVNGGRIAHARHHAGQRRDRLEPRGLQRLTIKGIYGREMFETWYKMTALIQTGLDISPVITHRFPYTQFQRRRSS